MKCQQGTTPRRQKSFRDAAMERDDSVEDFLAKVKQLDQQRSREDADRKQRLKDDILSMNMRSSTISYTSSRAPLPQSESMNDFNASISRDYRLNMDELVYESAYNYDKSRNKENHYPLAGDYEDEFSSSQESSRSHTYKKFDGLDIVRFDDFVPKKQSNGGSAESKYAKFKLNEDEKHRMEEVLSTLIGSPTIQPPTRQRKGSASRRLESLSGSPERLGQHFAVANSQIKRSPGKVNISRFADNEEENRPTLPARRNENGYRPALPTHPTEGERDLPVAKPKSPFVASSHGVSLTPVSSRDSYSPSTKPQVRPKSAWLEFMIKNSSSTSQGTATPTSGKPPVRPKSAWLESTLINSGTNSTPQGIAEIQPPRKATRSTWLDSAQRGSTSTNQGLKTTAKFTIKKQEGRNTWLDSAKERSSSTSQGLETSSKIALKAKDSPASWLDSANKRLSTSKEFEQPRSKIAPIVPSKSNTLSQIIERNEMNKSEAEKALKEWTGAKLNHVDSISSPQKMRQSSTDPDFKPIALKKIRSLAPSSTHASPEKEVPQELVSIKLKPSVPVKKPSLEVPEALKRSQTLKPAVPTRKVSLELPEALKKSQKLKPAVPIRKVSVEVPEALAKKGSLREAKPLPQKQKDIPEGLKKSRELKPAPPKRKVSVKELEGLQALNNLKKSEAPEVKQNPRVLSQSKEASNQKLQQLKHVKEQKAMSEPVDKRAMLQLVLQRAQTAPSPQLMAKEKDIVATVQLKKASTFNGETSGDLLTHPNKTRSKGPKRRVPKTV